MPSEGASLLFAGPVGRPVSVASLQISNSDNSARKSTTWLERRILLTNFRP